MKRIIVYLSAFLITLIAFVSCGKGTAANESYLRPVKKDFSETDRQTIDQCYREMVALYPQFGKIPREMLEESIFRVIDSEYCDVTFTFCFGGIPTDCHCTFSTSSKYPEGKWDVNEDGFSEFYQKGIDEKTMKEIRACLSKDVSEYLDTYHLDKSKLSDESPYVYWEIADGQIYACCEHIADTTELTEKEFGCGDHVHVFGKVLVELSGESVKLTPLPVVGG